MGWFDTTARSEAEIEREISDEIEFHLEQRTRELVEQGLSFEVARSEAERRFGSPERVRQSCRFVHFGERIMLQRINLALNLFLACALVLLGFYAVRRSQSDARAMEAMQAELSRLSGLLAPRAPQSAPASAADALAGLRESFRAHLSAAGNSGSAAQGLAQELAEAPAGAALQLAKEFWPSLPQRAAVLEAFARGGGHTDVVDVLVLGVADTDPAVRSAAFRLLKSYAWQDLEGKPRSLVDEWHGRVRGTGVVNTLRVSVSEYKSRLALLRGEALRKELALLDEIDLTPGGVRGYDALDELWSVGNDNVRELAEGWLSADDRELQLAALRFIGHFQLPESFVRDYVLGILTAQPWTSSAHLVAACRAVAATGQVRSCFETLRNDGSEARPEANAAGFLTLRLLRACVEFDTPEVREAVGNGILCPLLGLQREPGGGSARWLAWWKENRPKLGPPKFLELEDARWLDAR